MLSCLARYALAGHHSTSNSVVRKLKTGVLMALPFVEEKVEGGKVEYAPHKPTLIDLYKYYEGVGNQARGQMVVTVN
jgi:hypothetical protein